MKKKIGILGSGVVGQALAKGFITHGYEVMIGTRDENKLSEWHKNQEKCKIGKFNDSAEFGEIVVLVVKGTAAKETLEAIDEENLEGKTIIDATNPISNSPPENGILHYFTSLENSLMEQLQFSFPKSNFVKAFNSIGNAFMVNPDFNGIKPTMFICGNNHEAKKEVTLILDLFGFEVEDMGKVEAARAIEPLCILWCIPGFLRNDWSHAFKLLKK